jgi:hypothetical protein
MSGEEAKALVYKNNKFYNNKGPVILVVNNATLQVDDGIIEDSWVASFEGSFALQRLFSPCVSFFCLL